jgi:uncharacterized protein YoaH (UPF0181 family)
MATKNEDASFLASDLEVLTRSLRTIFRAAPAGENITALQGQYTLALAGLAQFIKRCGIGDDISQRFEELAAAMGDLPSGTRAPILTPAKRTPVERSDIWSVRVNAVLGVESLILSGLSPDDAIKLVATKYRDLDRLRAPNKGDLKTSLKSWRNRLTQGRVENAVAKAAFITEMKKLQYTAAISSPGDRRKYAHDILAAAVRRAKTLAPANG